MHTLSAPLPDIAEEVRQLAYRLSLGNGRYNLLRKGTNIVLINRTDQTIARVSSLMFSKSKIEYVLLAAQQMAGVGAPTIVPLTNEVYTLAGGEFVNFWPLAEQVTPTVSDMAQLNAVWHRCPTLPSLRLWTPRWQTEWRNKLLGTAQASSAPRSAIIYLEERLLKSHKTMHDIYDPGCQIKPLHGDPYPANVVKHHEKLLFCDLDNIAKGPVEVDLAAMRMYCVRIWGGNTWQQFLEAYTQPINEELLDCLLVDKQVAYCLWTAALWDASPLYQRCFLHQIETWEDTTALWKDL